MIDSLSRKKLTEHMIRLADGDRTAFDYVFTFVQPLVHGLAVKMIGEKSDAEDISQQALMKVFSRCHEFDKERDALSWILGITSYECKTFRQQVKRRKEDFKEQNELNDLKNPALSPEELHLKNELENYLRDLLKNLSPQEQETILALIDEVSRPEVSAATYRKRLQRTLEKLRGKWKEHYE